MKSRWYELKEDAIDLRKKGLSMNAIEKKYGIARSTLSGWFKKVDLTSTQKKKLLRNSNIALIAARKKAVLWHNSQKKQRIETAKTQALQTLKDINTNNKSVLELALAILYLGEGSKTTVDTVLGNSDPLILKFFLSSIKKIYGFDVKNIKCELHLRADQNSEKMKHFWAKELEVPLDNFKQTIFDKRTAGSKTYPQYKGVCVLRCGNVAIQRRLLYLAHFFCEEIIK
jgi:transposase